MNDDCLPYLMVYFQNQNNANVEDCDAVLANKAEQSPAAVIGKENVLGSFSQVKYNHPGNKFSMQNFMYNKVLHYLSTQ